MISIHAPARGATAHPEVRHKQFKISIHAPARGATSIDIYDKLDVVNFNPRSRKGSDFLCHIA